MEPVLMARDLCKKYEGFSLSHVSLDLAPGSILGLFGPNGAGKTTLVKLLAGQMPPDSGELRLFNLGYGDSERNIKDRVGYCPQEAPFYRDQTLVELARFVAPFFSRWDGALFYGLLERFRIFPEKKFHLLSTGQKTLFALALALAHHPELLLLDEPAAGLDDANRRFLFDSLRAFVGEGDKAVLISSHVADGLDEVAEQVLFIANGATLLAADKDELLARWKWVHFRAEVPERALVGKLTAIRRHPFGSSGLCPDFPAVSNGLAKAMAAGDIRVENAKLSDVLVHLTQGG